MASNAVCHIEFQVTNLERSKHFYESVFGWDFRSFGGDMVVFGHNGVHIGGLQKVAVVTAGKSPSVWIEVASAAETMELAIEAGGKTAVEVFAHPQVGITGVFTDPDGNEVGLVQYSEPT